MLDRIRERFRITSDAAVTPRQDDGGLFGGPGPVGQIGDEIGCLSDANCPPGQQCVAGGCVPTLDDTVGNIQGGVQDITGINTDPAVQNEDQSGQQNGQAEQDEDMADDDEDEQLVQRVDTDSSSCASLEGEVVPVGEQVSGCNPPGRFLNVVDASVSMDPFGSRPGQIPSRGDTITIQATFRNRVSVPVRINEPVTVNGERIDTFNVRLSPRSATTLDTEYTIPLDADQVSAEVAGATVVQPNVEGGLEVSNPTVSPDSDVPPGGTVEMGVTFVNPLNQSVSRTVEVTRNGSRVDTVSLNLGPGGSQRIERTFQAGQSGRFEAGISAADSNVGFDVGLQIDEQDTGPPPEDGGEGDPDILIQSVVPSLTGSTLTLDYTAVNTGFAQGSGTIEASVDIGPTGSADATDSRAVQLDPGEQQSGAFSFDLSNASGGQTVEHCVRRV